MDLAIKVFSTLPVVTSSCKYGYRVYSLVTESHDPFKQCGYDDENRFCKGY